MYHVQIFYSLEKWNKKEKDDEEQNDQRPGRNENSLMILEITTEIKNSLGGTGFVGGKKGDYDDGKDVKSQ